MIQAQRLDTVVDITMGQAPEGESYNVDGEGLPLIAGAGDFGELHPEPKKFTTSPGKTCQVGDVVLGIRATIGEKVLADGVYCLGRGVAGLRAKSGLDERYLWHWLTHIAPTLAAKAKGATFKQVNRGDIGELRIALPPLPEQRRTAEILDKADALRAKRRAALAQLDTLTQSIFLDMFGDPATNPKGWRLERLGQLAETTSGGTPSREVDEYFGGKIPWVKSGELHKGLVTTTEECLTRRGLADSSAKLMSPGTVLVAMYGATVGAVAVLGIEAATNQAVCCISPSDQLTADYLVFVLRRSTPALLAKRVGGAQPNLSQDLLRRLVVPVPPSELQKAFAGRVASAAATKHTASQSLCEMDALFAAIQHRAYCGDLAVLGRPCGPR